MAQATFHFPRGFLWGTATSSYQVEGNNTKSNWWTWEQEPGRIVNEEKSGLADDWWGGRWREDFDRAKQAGQNAHRMSVEWGRIQPTPDHWDESAIEHYREMVRGLVERGMTPIVTLQHYTIPIWAEEQGGWLNQKISAQFATYCRKVVDALREYVNLWVTINEPNALAFHSYVEGTFPPGKQDIRLGIQGMITMVRAHAAAYQAIHETQNEAHVGIALYYRGLEPAHSWLPLDRLVRNIYNGFFNEFFPSLLKTGRARFPLSYTYIPEAKGTQDFFGLNYYTREFVAFDPSKVGELFGKRFFLPGAETSKSGQIANAPQGMFDAIQWALQFGIPIIITENGIDDADDDLRPRYLIQHLHQVWRAVNFNYPVKGYFHWSLVDNFEWERAWTERFGLWEVDVESQARIKRPSADLYAEIAHENGISSEMVEKYAPELMDRMFPG